MPHVDFFEILLWAKGGNALMETENVYRLQGKSSLSV